MWISTVECGPFPLCRSVGVFLHKGVGFARMAAEQVDIICKHCAFNAAWYNGLQIVDTVSEKLRQVVRS